VFGAAPRHSDSGAFRTGGAKETPSQGGAKSMTERALVPASAQADGAGLDEADHDNPAIRLLDALRAGDGQALAASVGQSTTVTAENMPWACRGPDEVQTMLREARERFPGLTYESSTRHVGFGLVIEEARVRDVAAEAEAELAAEVDDAARVAEDEARAEIHPMWDDPAGGRASELVLWNDGAQLGLSLPPVPLNMPVRVTVRHDDLQVHEVVLSFPAALLKRALGQYVDPLEVSLGEVQSAFIAPVGAGFTTQALAGPEMTLSPARSDEEPPAVAAPDTASPPRRRRRGLVLLVLLVLALLAGAGWWFVQGTQSTQVATPPQTSASPTVATSSRPSQQAAAQPASSKAPTVTGSQSSSEPSRKPTVTLRSDLAFGFNSSTLSPAAKAAIATVAQQVRTAGLTGKIYVDGYTDDIGSAAYGLVLSQRRADAVSTYLQSQLLGAPVSIVSVGHGEANPIASNATPAGQKQNRRVTLTLPQP
jgi:outer membrane protein OmpA-like peptidoglycan-associated protein